MLSLPWIKERSNCKSVSTGKEEAPSTMPELLATSIRASRDFRLVSGRPRRMLPLSVCLVRSSRRIRGRNPFFGVDVVNGCLHSLCVLLREEPQVFRTDFDFCTNALIQHRKTPKHGSAS